MIRHIKIEGLTEVIEDLQQLRDDKIPTALRNGINDTAFGLKAHLGNLINKTFKSPNPATAKNIFVRKATKESQYAIVFYDQLYARGLNEYMMPLIEGGSRVMKPSEQRFNRFWVPGIGAKLNKYGNMSGGQVTQILSRLGRFGDVMGYDMNQTAASKRRLAAITKRTGKKSTEYFMITSKRGGLKPGIYMRTEKRNGRTSVGAPNSVRGKAGAFQKGTSGTVRGRGAVPIMIFTNKAPRYRPMLPFFTSGQKYIDQNLPANIHKEVLFYIKKGFRR